MSSNPPRRAVAHTREFLADTLTPLGVYRRLAQSSPYRFLLESVTGGEQVSRYSFLGAWPSELYRLYPDRLEREVRGRCEALPGPPLTALRGVVAGITAPAGPAPFTGGFVGWFGYDLVRLLERLPNRPADRYGLPVAVLGRFDRVLVFDHARQRLLGVANEIEGEASGAEAEQALDELEALLRGGGSGHAAPLPAIMPRPMVPEPSLSGDEFRAAVARAKEHIAAGDIFQVVLARRFRMPYLGSALALYRALRLVNPSPYMVLWETP
jgi:anthranilate synthase component 1